MTQRLRNYCFTDFQLRDWETVFKSDDNIRYICYGREVCPTTKKEHYQGWLQLEKPRTLSSLKKNICNQTHFEGCRGTELHNEKYCTKDGNFTKLGEFKTQGQRTDLEGIFAQIEENVDLQSIASNNPVLFCKYRNGINQYISMVDEKTAPKERQLEVEIHIGESGSGKTTFALNDDPDAYLISGQNLRWFDGYAGEKTLIIDDYDDGKNINILLELLNKHKTRLPVKNGHIYARWTKVHITTRTDPEKWKNLSRASDKKALSNRVTNFYQHYDLEWKPENVNHVYNKKFGTMYSKGNTVAFEPQ